MTVFDASQYTWPYNAKYLEEQHPEFADWFIFGEHPGTDLVDIVDSTLANNEIMTKVPRRKAERICIDRRVFVARLITTMNGA